MNTRELNSFTVDTWAGFFSASDHDDAVNIARDHYSPAQRMPIIYAGDERHHADAELVDIWMERGFRWTSPLSEDFSEVDVVGH